MSLETASFLSGLVATNPVGTDQKSQGDDHLRLIKAVLLATFPGMAGTLGRVQAKAATFNVTQNDNTSLFNVTATAVVANLNAASALGNGCTWGVYANGFNVTVTPNGTDTINGVNASITVPNGSIALFWSNGAAVFATVIAALNVNQAFTKGQAVTPVALTDAATVAIDASLSNAFKLLATGAVGNTRALGNPTNMKDGQSFTVRYTQDATGGRLLTFGSKWKFPSAAPSVSTAANARTIISGIYWSDLDVIDAVTNRDFS